MAERALCSYLGQTYDNKELIIWDDLLEPSFLEPPQIQNVIYLSDGSRSIVNKRNACCQAATGDVIAHWDSDDWSSPERLRVQLEMLKENGKAVTGFSKMLFVDEENHRYARYTDGVDDYYAIGSSLCYRRDWWQTHPFEQLKYTQEDNQFVARAREAHQLVSCDARRLMVASVHSGNTCPKTMDKYQAISRDIIPTEYFLNA